MGEVNESEKLSMEKAPALCSRRWNLAALGFFGFLFVYVVRVNLSVAIICMVRIPPSNQSAPDTNLTTRPSLPSPSSHLYEDSNHLPTTNPTPNTYTPLPSYPLPTNHSTPPSSPLQPPQNGSRLQDPGNSASSITPPGITPDHSPTGVSPKWQGGGDGGEGVVVVGSEGEREGESQGSQCGGESLQEDMDGNSQALTGEFDWDRVTRSRLLSMYFYGYIFTQIPGGWLAGRYGGRRVWGFCQLVSAICTLLTPLAARVHVDLTSALRFVLGLAAGVTFPCFHAMMGRWAPKLERSKLTAFAFAGPPIGTILTFSLSALLCSYGFDNGWGSIFYLSGAGNALWVVLWMWSVRDTPAVDTKITAAERHYILTSIGESAHTKEKLATPWKSMFTSGPLWAIIIAHLCNNYTNYTLLTSLPAFMKEALKFDIKQNGALSAIPYLCQAVVSVLVGQLADFLRAGGYLNTKNTRRLLQTLSFLGQAVCLSIVGYMQCHQRNVAVFLLCLCLSFAGLNRAAYTVNHIDLAPRYAGILFGITNTAGTIPGMIAPMVAGVLTPNRTADEWRTVFFVCAGVHILGALVFAVLVDGEAQSWAVPPEIVTEYADVTSGTEGTEKKKMATQSEDGTANTDLMMTNSGEKFG